MQRCVIHALAYELGPNTNIKVWNEVQAAVRGVCAVSYVLAVLQLRSK